MSEYFANKISKYFDRIRNTVNYVDLLYALIGVFVGCCLFLVANLMVTKVIYLSFFLYSVTNLLPVSI